MCSKIIQVEKYGNNRHTIASYLYSYLEEKMLVTHLQLLSAHGRAWFLRHFNWQKHTDERVGMPGFLAVHQPTRFFIQSRDLTNVIENWEQMDEFKDFITEFDDSNNEYTKDELIKPFLQIAENRHNKHFEQWIDKL